MPKKEPKKNPKPWIQEEDIWAWARAALGRRIECLCKHGAPRDEYGDDISYWEPGYKLCGYCCEMTPDNGLRCYFCLARDVALYIFDRSINHRAILKSHYKSCKRGGDIDEDALSGRLKEGSQGWRERQRAAERAEQRQRQVSAKLKKYRHSQIKATFERLSPNDVGPSPESPRS